MSAQIAGPPLSAEENSAARGPEGSERARRAGRTRRAGRAQRARRALRAAGLAARQERPWLLALPLVVLGVTAALAPNYATTYADPDHLATAVAASQANKTLLLLYGTLTEGSDAVGLAAWELGALTSLALGVILVLRSVALTRASEEEGRSETLRALGVAGSTEVLAASSVLLLECALLGLGAGAGLLALDGASPRDAAAYGCAIAACGAVLAALTVLLAQVLATAVAARAAGLLGLALLAAGSGLSAAQGWSWAGAWSPFALRGAIEPGAANRSGPVVLAALAVVALLALAGASARRRDLGAALLPLPAPRRPPLRARGALGLVARLGRGQALGWALTTGAVGGLLVEMGHGTVEMARSGAVDGGSLGSVTGGGDPGLGFLRYVGVLAGALACAQGVVVLGRVVADERSGRVEMERACGPGPRRLMVAWALWALGSTALSLAAATAAAAVLGPSALGVDAADALRAVAGQWPASLAAVGIGAVLAGWVPGAYAAAWAPVLLGLGVSQLGATIGLSQAIIDAAPLALAGEPASAWLAVVGAAGLALGLVGVGRRDLRPPAPGGPSGRPRTRRRAGLRR